ncbi:Hsp20/alpha crystallin family protein [Halosimplex salinum]|uniref:Hsp20/alpha crystallin family protein n=1 Tax=Halosimplex salinum TaxID=1710538 RepID=UPI000F4A366E|nr:Hsp20/alpha crystallin family protein [Halosimplex salinum]
MTHHPDHEVELYNDDGSYRVFVDLPGFDPGDVDVTWLDHRLSISAERTDDAGSSRVFHHHVTVPREVDADAITATYRDDVLDIELPIRESDDPPGLRIDVRE